MEPQRKILIAAAVGVLAVGSAMTAVAMTPGAAAGHDGTKRQYMSALKVSGLAGYLVRDSAGREVGRVVDVQTDEKDRTRYVHAVLNGGADVRVAAFRARLDRAGRAIDLTVPVAAVVNDPGALIAPAPDTAKMTVASAMPPKR
jgi:sporulation protein YlmC with PRC-barrel domain